MNIYLDIDGVLLANEAHAAAGADEFLAAVILKYPKNTFWLTTHCWQGENRCVDVLGSVLSPKTVALLPRIQPTDWGELKTDAIDFGQPFLWFDDDLLPEEAEVLRRHNATSSHILVDIYRDPEQLQKLARQFFGSAN